MDATLLRLVAAQICLHGCLTGLRMAAPLWALREYDSAGLAGVMVALFAVSQVFLALPAGRFVDRHGLTRPIGLSVLLAFSGAAGAAIMPSIPTLVLGALLTGGASGLTIIALQRHIGRTARDPAERRQLFSWLAIGPSLSNVLGPLLAGVVIDQAGFQAAFAVLALLPLLTWLAARALPRAPGDYHGPATTRGRPWTLFQRPDFSRLLLVNWVLSTCWDVHTFMVPVIGHERGFSASAIGAILGAFAFATVVVRVVMPWLANHLRERQVLITALIVTALSFSFYPLLANPFAMGAASMVLGLALGSVQPMIMSALHQMVPPQRVGEAIALRLMVINASSVVMPLVFGAAGAALGATVVFWLVGTAATGGAWVARRVAEMPDAAE
jgi:MFS family permease